MRQRATALARRRSRTRSRLDEERIEQFADCTPEAQTKPRRAVAAVKALRTQLKSAEPQVLALESEAADGEPLPRKRRRGSSRCWSR